MPIKKKIKNEEPVKFWEFKNKADSTIGELYLYGYISSFAWFDDDITPETFKTELENLGDISELHVYVNSGGGDVFSGQAIYNILSRVKVKKTVHIDGLAASIASIIVLAGDIVHMPKNALFMIHDPITGVWGNIEDFEKTLNALKKVKETLVNVYDSKSNLKRAEIEDLMRQETWLTAEEAYEWGFIDEVDEEKQVAASVQGKELFINGVKMDFSDYKNSPKIDVDNRKTIKVCSEIDMQVANLALRKHKYQGGL